MQHMWKRQKAPNMSFLQVNFCKFVYYVANHETIMLCDDIIIDLDN